MRKTPTLSFLTALVVAAALLAGCGSSGIGDVLGGGSRDSDRVVGDVRGTVESVDTRSRLIVVNREGSTTYLRGGEGDEVVLSYDDSTRVDYQGRTFRPEDLERGDRIVADVDQTSSDRLYAQGIQVLYDVSGGTDTGGGVGDSLGDDLRGVVRYVDTRDRTLEIVPSNNSRFSTGRDEVVVVHYDAQTVVEYQGRRYSPENLERGDEVELDIRDTGGRLIAEQIVVLGEDRSITR